MKHVWFTDCQSLSDYLKNPVPAACEDKRLEIDLEGLREYLWEYPDGTPKDEMTEDQHDKPRWIDTSAMIVDPLTKAGTEWFHDRLVNTLETNWFDLRATPESELKKLAKQKRSMEKIKDDAEDKEEKEVSDDIWYSAYLSKKTRKEVEKEMREKMLYSTP